MKTIKNFTLSKLKLSWAVISPQNIVLQAGFRSKNDALDFRDNSYGGYYNDCSVRITTTH